jgi:hypothetical protein
MRTMCVGLAVGGVGLMLASGSLGQVVAYNSFGPDNTFSLSSGWFTRGPSYPCTAPDWTQGFLFEAQASGGIIELLVPIHHSAGNCVGAGNEARFEIRADDNQTPGALVGQFAGIFTDPPSSSLVTVVGDGSIELTAGQSYWLVLFSVGDSSVTWRQNTMAISTLRFWSRDQMLTFSYGTVTAPAFRVTVMEPSGCYANCDNSTTPPVLNVEDFVCFINEFSQGLALPAPQQIGHYANCDNSTTEPVLNVEDFICFIDQFSQGCP